MSARPSPLAFSIRNAALALSFSASLLAVGSAWAEPQAYNIPAGSLAASLSQFAAASAVTLSFSSDDVGDRQSPGLQGEYELEQGFARLLQGSGLHVQQAGEKRYILISLNATDALQLSATNINASALDNVTENSGSYTLGSTAVGSKVARSLREVPHSVSVITRQQIEDQNLSNLTDVMGKMTGVSLQKGGISQAAMGNESNFF